MKLARISWRGSDRWAEARGDVLHVLAGDPFTGLEDTTESLPLEGSALLAPVRPSKILCVGRNYDEHRREMGYESAGEPSVFMKPPTALLDPGGMVVLPPRWLSRHVEHEAELAVVVGRAMRFASPVEAGAGLLGFTCADDVTARDLQRQDAYPTRGKGFDTFCPVGPWIETDVDLDAGLMVSCTVNGVLRQRASTQDMAFDVGRLLSHLSQFTTLLPGDLVLTGSPGGSAPLEAGDRVEVAVSGIGVLRHGVAASPDVGHHSDRLPADEVTDARPGGRK